MTNDEIRQNAEQFIGDSRANGAPVEPGERIDRGQLAGQLRAAGDRVTDADVEAVAQAIEALAS